VKKGGIRIAEEVGQSDGEKVGQSHRAEVGQSDGEKVGQSHRAEVGQSYRAEVGQSYRAKAGQSDGEKVGQSYRAKAGQSDGEKVGKCHCEKVLQAITNVVETSHHRAAKSCPSLILHRTNQVLEAVVNHRVIAENDIQGQQKSSHNTESQSHCEETTRNRHLSESSNKRPESTGALAFADLLRQSRRSKLNLLGV